MLRDRRRGQTARRRDFAKERDHVILGDQFRRDGLGLFRPPLFVLNDHADFFAEESAGLVDLVDGHVDPVP